MTDRDTTTTQPYVDFRTRGFEHIVDLFRDGEIDKNLQKRIQLFETEGITERQRELITQRVGPEYDELVAQKLSSLAADSLRRRAIEEERTLESAKISLDPDDPLFKKYLELAGNPERLGAFVAWMDDLSVQGLGQLIHRRHSARGMQWDFLDETKGLSFELAGSFELGDRSHIYGVSDALERLKEQLPDFGMSFVDPPHGIDHKYDVDKMRDGLADDGFPAYLPLYSVSINQPVGDIISNTDQISVAHIAMRSDKLLVEQLLPKELRAILHNEHAKFADVHERIMAARNIKLMLGRYALTDSAAVVPDATVVYMRTAREMDQEVAMDGIGLFDVS